MTESYYIEPRTGTRYPLDVPRWCSDERTPLLITPQRGLSRDDIDRGTRSLWRYRASLPVEITNPISMGERCTPIVQKEWGDFRPYFKLEWFSPTCSFKDRGTAVMLSFLRQIGVDAVLEDSSGNGGASVAAFGAAGGMRVKILAPAFTSPAKIAQVRAYGAEVQLVEGPREESEAEAMRQSRETFYSSHNWQPFFLEGTKSIAYELWEDFNFEAPDNIVMPTGAGSNLLGCHMAFTELLAAGQIKKLPRLFAAQPLNCSPIDASFKAGVDTPVPREVLKTISEGTAIKHPLRLREMMPP
jgi:threonine synthase